MEKRPADPLSETPDEDGDDSGEITRAGGELSVVDRLHELLARPDRNRGELTTESAVSIRGDAEAGKYIVEREIGHGGMGRVYLAYDRDLRRSIALKVIQTRLAADRDKVARFLEEAQITGQLEHPGIPPVHDLGISGERQVYFTMKLLKGRTLKELLKELHIGSREARRKYSRTRLLQILQSVCHAVHFAHEKGVVHRDIKPENIMTGDYGEVQLMDWGLAKVVDDRPDDEAVLDRVETVRSESDESTLDELVQGTPLYMAPEQARGSGVDHRADVYALGATLYEILTFQPPRTAQTLKGLLEEARLGLVMSPRKRAPRQSIPEPLEEICMTALEFHPEDRYPSAMEMADAIQVYLDGSFENERRRQEAEALVKKARGVLRDYETAKAEAKRLAGEREAMEERAGNYPDRQTKASLLELQEGIAASDVTLAQLYTEAQTLLSAALASDADNTRARRHLGQLYLERFTEAEERRDTQQTIFYKGLLAQINDGSFDDVLRGDGALHLETDPGGAAMTLWRHRESGARRVADERVGTSPGRLEVDALPIGSYLVEIDKPGFASTRYPVRIGRNEVRRDRVRLLEASRLPEGFCYIPAGPFTCFGDPNVVSTFRSTQVVHVDGFAIGRFPVTCGEYLEFLNALREEDAEAARARCPRQSRDTGLFWREGDRGYELPSTGEYPWSASLPVFGISFDDALAYCAHRNHRDGRRYDLPTEREWEKAAKGVDGRFYSWGDRFDNEFCNNYYAQRDRQGVTEVDSFPEDCSPYGVRGAVGNVGDWCYFEGQDPSNAVAVRGGNWALTADTCRLATRRGTTRDYVSDRIGFRLVWRLD